ncbi:Hypothetical protein POVN_LOCUS9 [uncultured virus]|nr:Hypothetical protein POVN_LOCUS9 [uncultured virus]
MIVREMELFGEEYLPRNHRVWSNDKHADQHREDERQQDIDGVGVSRSENRHLVELVMTFVVAIQTRIAMYESMHPVTAEIDH